MDKAERERLGRIVIEAIARDVSGRIANTFDRADGEAVADAVAAALLPPGTVAVERARLARLIELAHAAEAYEISLEDPDLDRLRDAVVALKPGDADPLPGEGAAG